MNKRENGWYWVLLYGSWCICQYKNEKWLLDPSDEQPYTDESFTQIGDRLEPPETL